MKKIILTLLLAAATSAYAQQRIDASSATLMQKPQRLQAAKTSPAKAEGLSSIQRAVGYITANNPDSITLKGVMMGKEGTYPVAAAITADILSPYVGCKVVGIRVAAAQNLGKTNVFLNPIGNDGTIGDDGITKSQRLYEGWNNVLFNGDTFWEITEGQQLLVGFDYPETEAMVAAETGGLCTAGESKGTDFLIYNDYGYGMAWYRISNFGSLCVQLIVDVSSLPEKSLSLAYLDTGFRYKKADEKIELYTVAANTGREVVNGYSITCQIDDYAPATFTFNSILPEQALDHQQPVVAMPEDIGIGAHQITVTLNTEGMDIENSEDATATNIFYIYGESLQRQKNYVEQYTTQNNSMSATVSSIFNQTASSNNNMALVNVYDSESPLAIEEANYLHQLYAYTLPSFTINRSYFPGEEYIAYDVNYYVEQYAPLVPAIIDDLMAQDMMQPAFATVELQPQYDAANATLTVEVTGQLADGATSILGQPSVTVLLTEDNVVGKQIVLNPVTKRQQTDNNYTHNHVLRTFITPPLGAPVEVSGNQYSAQFTTTINPAWNIENMTLVAFITRTASEVDDSNVMQMDVTNCNSVTLAGLDGITYANSQDNDTPQYFTTDGKKANPSQLQRGIYIVRKGGKNYKVAVK